jgi:curli biogenesis system outer membrane secretion channel CsgG
MKARIYAVILCVLFAVFVSSCGGKSKNIPVGDTKTEPEPKAWNPETIAVYPFEVQDSEAKLSGVEVANLLTNRLLDMPGLKIVERDKLESILSELGLATSDLADKETQIAVGKLLNAQYIVFGTTNKTVSLMTARVVQTETGQNVTGLDAPYKDDIKSIQAFVQPLREKLTVLLQPAEGGPAQTTARTTQVEVTGTATIIDEDLAAAKTLALKDAYAKAVAQGAGVKLIRETQVENFQLVRDKIFSESVGYIAAYDILKENPAPPVYEVDVRATVSRAPLSDVEKLELLVKYLFGKPRVAVFVDAEANGEPLPDSRIRVIEGLIVSRLQQAGFSVLDPQTVEERKKELAESPDDEEAARIGSLLNAEVVIRGSFSTSVTSRLEELNGKKLLAPMITATSTGAYRVVNAETADLLYTFTHEKLLERSAQKGYGVTEPGATAQSLENFAKASADGLIMGFAAKLGDPVQLQLQVQNASLVQAEELEQQIVEMPEEVVTPPLKDMVYEDNIANYEVKTPSKKTFQKKLRTVQPQLIPVKSEFTTIVMKYGEDEPAPRRDSAENKNNSTDMTPPPQPYTGVVIDAAGLGLGEVTYPKIYYRGDNDETALLYGSQKLSRPGEHVEFWAAWTNTVEAAKAHPLVKGNPLVIRAVMLENKALIVNAADAQKINALEPEHHFLEQGKVVIVHD